MSTILSEGDIAVVQYMQPHSTPQFVALVTAPRLMEESDLLDEYAAHVNLDRSRLSVSGTYAGRSVVKLPAALVSRRELKRRIDATLLTLIGTRVTIGNTEGAMDASGSIGTIQQVWISEENGCVCFRFRQDGMPLPDVTFDELR